ncbi:hypothetical protein T440DRAFT_470103 [Plenodomus tracheiphilus IPT5]|uniref:Uncharacterized protein n=1 Tax=Plenodomus tracheiphilus IPT5 TaxID=1408161 RepID=A0A6A7AZE1_9PLEO|nr:hypothetical protein T440DRAFT_470103 [Plenodomus tracheiphilus IPT5]
MRERQQRRYVCLPRYTSTGNKAVRVLKCVKAFALNVISREAGRASSIRPLKGLINNCAAERERLCPSEGALCINIVLLLVVPA